MSKFLKNSYTGKLQRTKLTALIVIIVLLVVFIPTSIISAAAEEMAEDREEAAVETTETADTAETDETEEADRTIVEELTSLRDEYTKQFLLDDGTVMAVQYDSPIHYINEDNGEWKNIDNSFVAADENDFKGYSNKANSFKVNLAEDLDEDYLASISNKGYTLSFDLKNKGRYNSSEAKLKSARKSTGSLGSNITNYGEFCSLNRIESGLTYNSIANNVDLQYLVNANGLKENIIINDKLDSYEFAFTVDAAGLTLFQNGDGSISALDKDNSEIFYLPAPYMYDAEGESSTDVWYTLISSGDTAEIIISASEKWINKSAFPVAVDPIVYTLRNTSNVTSGTIAKSTGMLSNRKNYNYYSLTNLEIGMDDQLLGDIYYYSLLKFVNLPLILDTDVEIRSVTLNMYGQSISSSPNNYVKVKRMVTNWARSTSLTWNSISMDTYYSQCPTIQTSYLSNGCFTVDLTETYTGWKQSTYSNYGLFLEGSSGSDTTGYIYSERNDTMAYIPQLTIWYQDRNIGIEDSWSTLGCDMGNAGNAYANVGSGNLFVANTDISLSGERMPLNICHYYNTVEALKDTTSGNYGIGWRINLEQYLCAYETNIYLYIDGDGTKHWLSRGEDDIIKDVDGLGLTLTSDSTYYYLTDSIGNIYKFLSNASLSSITDNNGNVMQIYYSSNRINYILDGAGRRASFTYNADNTLASIRLEDYTMDPLDTDIDNLEWVISYSYSNSTLHSGQKLLAGITYYDGSQVNYLYSSTNELLSDASSRINPTDINNQDRNGYKFAYYNSTVNYAICRINEYTYISTLTPQLNYGKVTEITYDGLSYKSAYVKYGVGDGLEASDYKEYRDYYVFDKYDRLSCTYRTSNDSQTQPVIMSGSCIGYSDIQSILTTPLYNVEAVNTYSNLISNGNFNSDYTGWAKSTTDENIIGITSSYYTSSTKAAFIATGSGVSNYIQYPVTAGLSADQPYVVSAWIKAFSSERNAEKVYMKVTATSNGVTQTYKKYVLPNCGNWQFVSIFIPSAAVAYSNITVTFQVDYILNFCFIDDVKLYALAVNEKVRNMDAAVLAAAEYYEKVNQTVAYDTSTESYDTNNVTYDSNNNVVSYTDYNNVTVNYTYDAYGNILNASQTNGTVSLPSEYTYTTDGNYNSTVSDAHGLISSYSYENLYGLVSAITDANNITTNYDYTDNKTLLESISSGTIAVTYQYDTYNRINAIIEEGLQYNVLYDMWSNVSEINIENGASDIVLISYNYGTTNEHLLSITYGATNTVYSYTYDVYGRLTEIRKNNYLILQNTYNSLNMLTSCVEYIRNASYVQQYYITYTYSYDTESRCIGYSAVCSNSTYMPSYSVVLTYDDKGRLTNYKTYYSGSILFNEDVEYVNGITSLVDTDYKSQYTYDGFKRLSQKYVDIANYTYYNEELGRNITVLAYLKEVYSYYSYDSDASNYVYEIKYYNKTLNDYTLTYTYDNKGNIDTVTGKNENAIKYYYDDWGRLTREDNPVFGTWKYFYDDRGNITSKTEYAYTTGDLGTPLSTKSYGYDGAWEDLLTHYNSQDQNIEYDALGNPIRYMSATVNMTWQGRQLMVYGSNTFLYDSSGIRVQKNSTYYYTENGTVILEKSDNRIIFYNYDQDGLTSIYVRTLDNGVYHSSTYYVRKSLQGDIIALYTMSNNVLVLVCKYKYDAWGRCKVYNPDGSENITSTFIGNINPIRYRGYYYDTETGLYYLQSRYYDPETGRFINADDGRILGIGMNVIGGTNLFTYCLNNPIMDTDSTGQSAIIDWFKKTFGTASIVSINKSFDAEYGVFRYETGCSNSYFESGNLDKPVTFYVQRGTKWWKLSDYQLGINVNIGDGGFSIGVGGEGGIQVAACINNTTVEVSIGLLEFGAKISQQTQFNQRSADSYGAFYIRPVLVPVYLFALLGQGATKSAEN